jgi:hypothetical protein
VKIAIAAGAVAAEEIRKLAFSGKVFGFSRGFEKRGSREAALPLMGLEGNLPSIEKDRDDLARNLNLRLHPL